MFQSVAISYPLSLSSGIYGQEFSIPNPTQSKLCDFYFLYQGIGVQEIQSPAQGALTPY